MSSHTRASDSTPSLAPCGRFPNCVSSQAADRRRRVEPLGNIGPVHLALQRTREAIESMAGARVVEVTNTYLHAEFSSRLFRFVDDLELVLSESEGVLHVRSASRVGHWDWGANRRRVESLRRRLDKHPSVLRQ